MEQKEGTKAQVVELSKEEVANIFGGCWWEMRAVDGKLVFIFHCE